MNLETALKQLIEPYKQYASISLYHANHFEFSFRDQEQLPAASLIKLAILGTQMSQQPDLSDPVDVSKTAPVGGAGVLQLLSSSRYSLGDILGLMIADSDNFAANVMIDRLSMNGINSWLDHQEYLHTHLGRYLMDSSAQKTGHENLISAADALRLFRDLLAYFPQIEPWFINQQFRYKLPVSFDETSTAVTVMNKTGEGPMIDHDVARFQKGNDWYDIAVLTNGIPDRIDALNLLGKIGRVIYRSL
ncbi:serine hydrolase [Secundilactobacillus folii]|uniref:Serine hydrolase n=1 Tax=Secundilactobacillus folii TaxID=2678357 RepID=A0A7X2XWG5_9LACO|nr:serine hydrolase [Secundilactobacillus folii]MTV82884.1 serine hydrolase [Secundilactobacillus folii]